jgi:2-polyprenyl-3-methyl-5-hydroxy-6-metoxy-1,4-benzoquinol methylase
MNANNENDQEAFAFDRQIRERIENGHVPDLRRAPSCHYFYNNAWREPYYVALDFKEQADLFTGTLRSILPEKTQPRILEIGSGPGYLCLELARNGFCTTGIDLSCECVKIARQFADEDPWKRNRAPLSYVCGDFFRDAEELGCGFDAVVMLGAQHHFKDQDALMRRICGLLNHEGFVLAHEPTRDRMTMGTAAIMYLIQALLSEVGGYFQKDLLAQGKENIALAINSIFNRARYEDGKGNKVQSVHDNDAGYEEMVGALNRHFSTIRCEDRYAFFHEIIGGLRFDDQANERIAKFLHDLDAHLCETNVIQATEFFYVGKRKTLL